MRIERTITIAAPVAEVWKLVDEPDEYTHFMAGITRWRVEGRRRCLAIGRDLLAVRRGSGQRPRMGESCDQ